MAKSEKIVAEAANAANKVKCGSNMKQIGQALLLYANENSQKYPPDLGTLLVTQEITAEVFLCPSTGLTPPSGLGQWTREKQVAWVNANTSYAYRGAGKTNTLPKSYILLYEKLDHPDGSGINVLYGDGHVEFKPANEARQILKELGASSDGGNANPPALSGNNAAAQKSATFTSIERNGELRGLRVATITVDGAYARHFGLAERDVILQIGAFVVGDATATR
jgi:prepilin-type processing-associated H-X9-DG protein